MSERVRYRTLMYDNTRWDGFEFRADDIVISTSPKCGTTWTQMLCALLIFQDPHFDRPLTEISPWLDQQTGKLDTVLANLDAQQHRRFIKTHTPFDGLPFDDDVTYLCVGRDPRDAYLSMDHHWGNMDMEAVLRAREHAVGNGDLEELLPQTSILNRPDDPHLRFRTWVDDDQPPEQVSSSLRSVIHHVDTFWAQRERDNIALLHYSDLENDLVAEMQRLAEVLEIDIFAERVRELADAAGFEEMKRRADELAPNVDIAIWRDSYDFFHQGRSGQWRALLGDDDLAHYDERVRQLAAPDLADWMHHGFRRSN
ncbi:MAG: sulfotransferase domain-containing protein [Acidimicrobiia bacterium]